MSGHVNRVVLAKYIYKIMKGLKKNVNAGRMKDVFRKGYRFSATHRLIFGLACVLIIFVWIYREYQDSSKALTLAQLRQDLIKSPYSLNMDGHQDIIISAYMNSGSRLTGRLLGFLNQTFYFYEPLWKFTIWDYYKPPDQRCSTTEGSCRTVQAVTENIFNLDQFGKQTEDIVDGIPGDSRPIELMLHVLSNIFNCSLVPLKNVVQDRVHDHVGYSGPSWKNYRKCLAGFHAKSVCLRQLEELCKNKTHRVLKVLRLSFSSFQPLMEINPKLKIVHLVRDPRAIIHSRLYSRFYPIERPRKNDSLERNICEKMLNDIKDVIKLKIIYPGRVMVLYYEDLLENMHIRLKQVYNRLNLTNNKEEVDTLSKINVNLSPPEMGNSFTKDRKHDNAFWWRLHTTWEEVQRIDKWCGEVYKILGFNYLTRKQLRDDSVLSYKVPSIFKL